MMVVMVTGVVVSYTDDETENNGELHTCFSGELLLPLTIPISTIA
jgi:hypothetical protein